MKKGGYIVLGGIALLGVAGLYAYGQYKASDKFCTKIIKYNIKQLGVNKTVITIFIQFRNIGRLEIALKRYNLKIYANNTYIADIKSTEDTIIEPYKTKVISTDIELEPKKLLSTATSIITSTSNFKDINISIEGDVIINKFGILFNIPIKYSSTIREFTESNNSDIPC